MVYIMPFVRVVVDNLLGYVCKKLAVWSVAVVVGGDNFGNFG